MSNRKTIKVHELVGKANQYFAESNGKYGTREARKMLFTFVESFLMETDNYRGFRYLRSEEVPKGELPGIIPGKGGNSAPEFPDDSRISFYFTT